MSKRTKLILSALAGLTPAVAFSEGLTKLQETLKTVTNIVGTTIPALLFALALAYFLYGVFNYISVGAEEKKKEEARSTIIYGIIVLFVMSSVWGLVSFVQNVTGIEKGTSPGAPTAGSVQ